MPALPVNDLPPTPARDAPSVIRLLPFLQPLAFRIQPFYNGYGHNCTSKNFAAADPPVRVPLSVNVNTPLL